MYKNEASRSHVHQGYEIVKLHGSACWYDCTFFSLFCCIILTCDSTIMYSRLCCGVCVCVSVCVDSAAVSVGWGRHSQVWALLAWAVRHHLSLWQHRCHSCLLRVVCKLCRTNISRGSQLGLRRTHCDTVSVHSMASTWSTTTSTCSARLSQQSLVRLNTHTHTHTHTHTLLSVIILCRICLHIHSHMLAFDWLGHFTHILIITNINCS